MKKLNLTEMNWDQKLKIAVDKVVVNFLKNLSNPIKNNITSINSYTTILINKGRFFKFFS